MKIKDLTRGKYPVFTRYSKSNNEVSQELIDAHLMSSELENFLAEHQLRKEDAIQLLDRVPVFLVESSMAEEYHTMIGLLLSRNWRLNEPLLFCYSPERNRSLKNKAEIVN